MKTSPFLDEIRAEGRTEGRVEGQAEGRTEGRIWAILRVLTIRFDFTPPPELGMRIRARLDSDDLIHLLDAAVSAETVESFLAEAEVCCSCVDSPFILPAIVVEHTS